MSSYAIEFRWRMRFEPWFTELKNKTGKNHTGLGSAELLLLLPPQPKKLGIHRMPPTFPTTFSSAIPCQLLPLPPSLFSPLLFVLLPIISIFSSCGLLLHQISWCLWSHKVLLSQMNLSDNSQFPAVLPTPKCILCASGWLWEIIPVDVVFISMCTSMPNKSWSCVLFTGGERNQIPGIHRRKCSVFQG